MINEIDMLVHGTPCSMVRLTIQTIDGEYTVLELNKETADDIGIVMAHGEISIQWLDKGQIIQSGLFGGES